MLRVWSQQVEVFFMVSPEIPVDVISSNLSFVPAVSLRPVIQRRCVGTFGRCREVVSICCRRSLWPAECLIQGIDRATRSPRRYWVQVLRWCHLGFEFNKSYCQPANPVSDRPYRLKACRLVATQTLTNFCREATTLTFWDERKRDQDTLAIWEIGGLIYI